MRLIIILVCTIFASTDASSRATIVDPATLTDLVQWAIVDAGVPSDAWPAIDEAYAKYRAAFERLADRADDPWELTGALERGELSLAGLRREFERRLQPCIAEERGLGDGMHRAMGGDEAALCVALRWRLERMCRLLGRTGEYRLPPDRRTTVLDLPEELRPCVVAILPQAIAAAERDLVANLPLRELQRQAAVGFEASALPSIEPLIAALSTEADEAHVAFLQSLRRVRECTLQQVPAGEERARRLSRWWGPPETSLTGGLGLVALRHLRAPDPVRAAVEGAMDAYVADWEEGIAAWTSELDRCIAAGDREAFAAAWQGPAIRRMGEANQAFRVKVGELLGPDLAERWGRIAGGSVDLHELAEAIDPAHLDSVMQCDPWLEGRLLGRWRRRVEPSALILAAGPISPALAADLRRLLAENGRTDIVDAALVAHSSAWAERVEPAIGALRELAPELASRTASIGTAEDFPARARSIRRAWEQAAWVDDALFSEIASNEPPRVGAADSRRQREVAVALLRLRRAADLALIDASSSVNWLGEAFPVPVDPDVSIESVAEAVADEELHEARRILAGAASSLIAAMREASVRHDAMLALTRVAVPGPGRDATSDEREEYGRLVKERLATLAATHDCSLAAIVAAWSGARSALLAAWEAALEEESVQALRAAMRRDEHPLLAQHWALAEEGIRELLELGVVSQEDLDPRGDALRDVIAEHSRRQDASLRAFTDRAATWAVASPRSEDWTGLAPETWTRRAVELARFELHCADNAARAWRDAWLVVGEDELRRTAAGRAWLGPK